ncbi:hypothetical protein UQ64_01005 [Paenibacillus etheri]|uniref:Uncharacterized protein n=1 Tax=Paenibacillus etheri TaxID=1306852 RepID=A0A0W1AQW8_9BACL|nr:hypothetical protein UQ64_01005 [Paenibacillus etheri]
MLINLQYNRPRILRWVGSIFFGVRLDGKTVESVLLKGDLNVKAYGWFILAGAMLSTYQQKMRYKQTLG